MENIGLAILWVIMAVMLIFCVAILGFAVYDLATGVTCYEKWERFEPSYSIFGECKIVVNGEVIPADAYRIDDVTVQSDR